MFYVVCLIGYWGVIFIIIIVFFGNYIGKFFIYCFREDIVYEDFFKFIYVDLGEVFWLRYGCVMVYIINFFEQFLYCIFFFIMCGIVLYYIFFDSFVFESVWIVVVFIVVLFCVGVCIMKYILWISFFIVIVVFVILICVLVYVLVYFYYWRIYDLV